MTESLPRGNYGPGPTTIPTITWFEFVLNENLLENHLSQKFPDPEPVQLIKLFLQEADSQLASINGGSKSNGNSESNGDDDVMEIDLADNQEAIDEKRMKNYNVKALRLLALKTAAFLRWNLHVLDQGLPPVYTQTIITELLILTLEKEAEDVKTSQPELSTFSPEALFALQLYHRWCALLIVKSSYQVRPTRGPFTQGAYPNDPNNLAIAKTESIITDVKEHIDTTIDSLQRCARCGQEMRMPTLSCFGMPTKGSEHVDLWWDIGVSIPSNEYICQISFDVGSYFFYQESYELASTSFHESDDMLPQLNNPQYCSVDEKRLKGYVIACNSLVRTKGPSRDATIQDRVEECRKHNYTGLIDILLEDNLKQELSTVYRGNLENELLLKGQSYNDLYNKVTICNMIRGILEGKALVSRVLDDLEEEDEDVMRFLMQVLLFTMKGASYGQRSNLRCFILHLCSLLPYSSRFSEMLMRSELKSYFPADESLESMLVEDVEDLMYKDIEFEAESTASSTFSSMSKESSTINLGIVEKQLLHIYDPDIIHKLIMELCQVHGYQPKHITELSEEWKLPRELRLPLEKLPVSVDQSYIFILLAKARHLLTIKLFEKARLLLITAENVVKDTSYLLSKQIRWQVLLADLQQYFHNESLGDSSSVQDLIKKTKTCLTSVRLGQEIQPTLEVLELCASFLLNIREWDYLTNMHGDTGFIEFGRLLSVTCKEVHNLKSARKPARDLWEAVVQMFMMNVQSKRSAGGRESAMQRDTQIGILPRHAFVGFLSKLKDTTVLGLLISCLTKFYNILKDDITSEISSDFVSIWPAAISNVSSLNTPAVTDAVTVLMTHSLEKHPHQPTWLKTQADLHFAHAQYGPAMKNYMEAGVVASDFFSYNVPRNIFDDQVYKRMIRCCSYLQCHTQVAVLCQFLDEVDYTTAFKSLQEKNTYDAMDTYYGCIWDISILEYLVHLHLKRGEMDKKQTAMRAIGQLELNCNNPDEILQRAVSVRRSKFLRSLAKQYI